MKLTGRHLLRGHGRHRAPRVPGQLVGQRFTYCPGCGDLVSHTIHGQLLVCAEGHEQPAGGA